MEAFPCGSHLLCSLPRPTARRGLPCSPQRARRGSGRGTAAPCPRRRRARRAPRRTCGWAGAAGLSAAAGRRGASMRITNTPTRGRDWSARGASEPPPAAMRPRRRGEPRPGSRPGSPIASRQPVTSGAGGGTPRGREAPDFGVTELAPARPGGGRSPGGVPSALYHSARGDARPEMSTVLILKITPPASRKGRTHSRREGEGQGQGGGEERCGWEGAGPLSLPAEPGPGPGPGPARQAPHEATHPERAVEAASPAPPARAELRKGPREEDAPEGRCPATRFLCEDVPSRARRSRGFLQKLAPAAPAVRPLVRVSPPSTSRLGGPLSQSSRHSGCTRAVPLGQGAQGCVQSVAVTGWH